MPLKMSLKTLQTLKVPTIPPTVIDVLTTPAFWTALLLFKNRLIAWLLPGVPADVSQSFDELVLLVVCILSGAQLQVRRADRAFRSRTQSQ